MRTVRKARTVFLPWTAVSGVSERVGSVMDDHVYYTENAGELEFSPESYKGFRNLPQDYVLMEAYCVTRQEWGYLGRVDCGADCMCAAVYFSPEASDLAMSQWRYMPRDMVEAVPRSCVVGEHDLVHEVNDGSTLGDSYWCKRCEFMQVG